MRDDWGAFFLLFPTDRPWTVPASAWHCDADYTGPLDPPGGVKVHAHFGDIAPRAGGMTIVSGSHRLVAHWFATNPPPPGLKPAKHRRLLHTRPTNAGTSPRFLLNKDLPARG